MVVVVVEDRLAVDSLCWIDRLILCFVMQFDFVCTCIQRTIIFLAECRAVVKNMFMLAFIFSEEYCTLLYCC